MKKQNLFLAAILGSIVGHGQQPDSTFNHQQKIIDSLFAKAQQYNLSLVLPKLKIPGNTFGPGGKTVSPMVTEPGGFNKLYPGAIVLNRTNSGTNYAMPLDKMPVLVPDMNTLERMPGSHDFTVAPAEKMPNPYGQKHSSIK